MIEPDFYRFLSAHIHAKEPYLLIFDLDIVEMGRKNALVPSNDHILHQNRYRHHLGNFECTIQCRYAIYRYPNSDNQIYEGFLPT